MACLSTPAVSLSTMDATNTLLCGFITEAKKEKHKLQAIATRLFCACNVKQQDFPSGMIQLTNRCLLITTNLANKEILDANDCNILPAILVVGKKSTEVLLKTPLDLPVKTMCESFNTLYDLCIARFKEISKQETASVTAFEMVANNKARLAFGAMTIAGACAFWPVAALGVAALAGNELLQIRQKDEKALAVVQAMANDILPIELPAEEEQAAPAAAAAQPPRHKMIGSSCTKGYKIQKFNPGFKPEFHLAVGIDAKTLAEESQS